MEEEGKKGEEQRNEKEEKKRMSVMSPGCLLARTFCVLIQPRHPSMPHLGTLPATICLTWGLTTELLPRNMSRPRPHVINSRCQAENVVLF